MNTIKNNCDYEMYIELEGEIKSLCPINGRIDIYTLILSYIPNKKLVEIYSFKDYLKQFEKKPYFHEDIVNKLQKDFEKEIQPRQITIVLTEDSPGIKMTVKCGVK